MKKIVFLCLCVLLTCCGESEVNLGNGYKYVQLDGRAYAISNKDNRMVVDPNVIRYKVIGTYVVGERTNANIDERLSKKFGYFILNTQDGQLIEGLSKRKFESVLRGRNLNAEDSGSK